MTFPPATLHMLFGKIASGKSTLAAELAAPDHTVLISEDAWLGTLFGDQMKTGADYVSFSAKLHQVMGPHIISLLRSGLSVVLDYPANTVDQRANMRTLFEGADAAHVLHVLDVADDICLERLKARNAQGQHPFAVTEAQFHRFSQYVVMPTADEGFNMVHHETA